MQRMWQLAQSEKPAPFTMPDTSPKDDELAGTEQPFVQHLMELRDRMVKALIAVGIALFFTPGDDSRKKTEK